ncbi:hypothetical protein SAMN04490248_13723 [Salinihabitans flavidus]|uniref:Uncharacterized protein n=1 Tax=Salinihabitans flavidus TaxID=569882 RepID=A0A1H8VYM6_9RHOB|nr:hypothetical protein SAMN04490248_13723 [Salinihabitans flavidus]
MIIRDETNNAIGATVGSLSGNLHLWRIRLGVIGRMIGQFMRMNHRIYKKSRNRPKS